MSSMQCSMCGGEDMGDGDDGYFYCQHCGTQQDDVIDTGIATEDLLDLPGGGGAIYDKRHSRRAPPPPPPPSSSSLGPSQPRDFGSNQWRGVPADSEDYFKVIRWRYVMGLQVIVQLQCEVLVEKFNVNPLVCGIAGKIWLRHVQCSRVFEDGFAYQSWLDSENQGKDRSKSGQKNRSAGRAGHLHNIYNRRMVLVWLEALKKELPLSCSLAVSYLACHVAREPVISTDILRWAIEGKLPYFGVHAEIEKSIDKLDSSFKNIAITINSENPETSVISIAAPSVACPMSASHLFRPSRAFALQLLESMTASIAKSIGLSLPPVNFYAIAVRYLKQLSLPVEKIMPYACRIYEWSLPPELWLSANPMRLPTRISVMCILIVAIRILYGINGYCIWENALSAQTGSSCMNDPVASSDPNCKSNERDDAEGGPSSEAPDGEAKAGLFSLHKLKSDCAELLYNLDKIYYELDDKHEYTKDLPTYLQYCRDVLFATSDSTCMKHENELIEQLWEFYQRNQEDVGTDLRQKRSRDDDQSCVTPKAGKKHRDDRATGLFADGVSLSPDATPDWSPSSCDEPQSSRPDQIDTAVGEGEVLSQSLRDERIRLMKVDMEEHRFHYMPQWRNLIGLNYLHYARRVDDGVLAYIAHADYYILLRACAKVAKVDVRVLHFGVLKFEKRLGWIERRIDYCLHGVDPDDPDESLNGATDK